MPSNETTTKFKVDISDLKKNITEANRQIKLANAEFKAASAGMESWEKSTDGMNAKLKQLKTTLAAQKTVLASYEKQLELVSKEEGESSAAAENLKIKIANTQATIAQTESELKDLAKGFANAGKEANEAGSGGFTVFKAVLADLASNAIQATLDGLKKLGTAMIDLGKQSIAGYADYEQLAGGIETLFGSSYKTVEEYAEGVGVSMDFAARTFEEYQKRQQTVMDNANKAYKTAGMSANQYMETVTSFAASLNSSLGEYSWQAANYADSAIIQMSDNANKMGSDMESIVHAYQSFAKQNYTLLDNLKLGYGGTKTEMERLLRDAEEFEGLEIGSLDVSNFADIISAIGIIQDKLGITGTTAEEASSTISGSIASMKSAWQNFVAGLANPDQNPEELFNTVIDAAEQVWENLKPVLQRLVENAIDLVKSELNKRFPEVYKKLQEARDAIKSVFEWILKNKNAILATIAAIGAGLAAFNVATMIMNLVKAFKAWKVATEGMTIAQRLLNVVMEANPIGLVIAAVTALVTAFITLWNTSEEFRQFWIDLWDGIKETAGAAWDWIKGVFSGAWDGIKKIWNGAKNFFSGVWDGIKGVFSNVRNWFSNVFQGAADAISTIFNGIVGVIKAPINFLINALNTVIDGINKIKIPSWVPGIGGKGINIPRIPNLARGGILEKGQIGLLEGNGAEAVVPLENNKKWIAATAKDLKKELTAQGIVNGSGTTQNGNQYYYFNQTNNSPKALSRLDIYRQTRNQIAMLKGGPLNA